jgi:hypothetical protein
MPCHASGVQHIYHKPCQAAGATPHLVQARLGINASLSCGSIVGLDQLLLAARLSTYRGPSTAPALSGCGCWWWWCCWLACGPCFLDLLHCAGHAAAAQPPLFCCCSRAVLAGSDGGSWVCHQVCCCCCPLEALCDGGVALQRPADRAGPAWADGAACSSNTRHARTVFKIKANAVPHGSIAQPACTLIVP